MLTPEQVAQQARQGEALFTNPAISRMPHDFGVINRMQKNMGIVKDEADMTPEEKAEIVRQHESSVRVAQRRAIRPDEIEYDALGNPVEDPRDVRLAQLEAEMGAMRQAMAEQRASLLRQSISVNAQTTGRKPRPEDSAGDAGGSLASAAKAAAQG